MESRARVLGAWRLQVVLLEVRSEGRCLGRLGVGRVVSAGGKSASRGEFGACAELLRSFLLPPTIPIQPESDASISFCKQIHSFSSHATTLIESINYYN